MFSAGVGERENGLLLNIIKENSCVSIVNCSQNRTMQIKTETKRMAWSGKVHALFSW